MGVPKEVPPGPMIQSCAQARRTVQRAPVGFERGFQAAHGSPQVPEVVGRDR